MTISVDNLWITTPKPKPGKTEAQTYAAPIALADASEFVYTFGPYLRLWAPTTGAATKSVHRTRCEWMTDAFAKEDADDHWNRQSIVLLSVNHAKKAVISQLHVDGQNNPPVKVFWDNGNVTVAIRESNKSSAPKPKLALGGVELGIPFAVVIHLTKKGSISVTVTQGANRGNVSGKLDETWDGEQFKFHGGIYNQVDFGLAGELPGEGTLAELQRLEVTHENKADQAPEEPSTSDPSPVSPAPPVEPIPPVQPASQAEVLEAALLELQGEAPDASAERKKQIKALINEPGGYGDQIDNLRETSEVVSKLYGLKNKVLALL